ncbi:MAG TPA: hypothetical protein PLU73_10675 [Bacteroidia bacterium]|nr:hypothetical protein [Bacteroidia bacterium]
MSELSTIFPVYFIVLIILVAVSTFIGNKLLKIVAGRNGSDFFSDFFFSSLTGTTFLVVFISLYTTQGASINFVFILLAFIIYFENNKQKGIQLPVQKNESIRSNKDYTIILLFLVFAYLWNVGIVFKFSGFPISEIEKDSYYYAELSKCMINTGQENTFATADLINEKYHSPTPYHYYDLWLNGWIAKIFHLNYSISLYLVIYSYFMILFAAGIYSCFERGTKTEAIKVILSVLLIYVSGIYITERLMHLYQYQSQMEGMAERYGGKLAAAACFALAAVISYVKFKKRIGLILLLALPVVSISLAPSVYAGLFLYAIYHSVRKNEEQAFCRRLLVYTTIIMGAIGGFYFLHKNNSLNYRLDKAFYEYTDFYEFSFFRFKFFVVEFFLKSWAQPLLFILNYFPFLLAPLLLYFSKRSTQELRTMIQLLILFWICGLSAFSTLYQMDDANQLFINMHILWHVLFAFCFTLLFQIEVKFKKIVLLLFGATLVVSTIMSFTSFERIDYYGNKISENYIQRVNEEFYQYNEEVKGGVMYDKKFYRNVLISYPIEFYLMPFTFNPKVYTPFNLTPDNIDEKWNQYQYTKAILRSPFVQFLNEGGRKNRTLIDNQKEFIKKHKLKYLVIPKSDTINYSRHFNIRKEVKDLVYGQKILFLED